MQTYVIDRPQDITLSSADGKASTEFPFDTFLSAVLNHPCFAADFDSIVAAARIEEAFRSHGPKVELRADDCHRLRDVLRHPGPQGYGIEPPGLLRRLLPYFGAIFTAAAQATGDP